MDRAEFRSQFPIVDTWAFFDHAAVSPIPLNAVAALHAYADEVARNGRHIDNAASSQIYKA